LPQFLSYDRKAESMLVILVLLLLLAALLYPYASVFFARLRMLRKLIAEAKANGFRAEGSFLGMLTARNRSDRYELLLVREDRLIAVKLWAAYRRSDSLLLTDRGRVVLYRSGRTPMATGKGRDGIRQGSKERAVPRTRLPKAVAERKDILRVLLVYPSYREIVLWDGEKRQRLNSQDTVFDKQLHTPSSFRRLLSEKHGEAVDPIRQNANF